jgi:uncharacterized YigZ family protein
LEDSYKTIKESSRAEIKIQRSKFIASAFHCQSREDAEAKIAEIAREYHDATHNCFAYRIYPKDANEIFRYSDAGEPSGTAGKPIYDAILSLDLYDSGIVVTRYFGGVKLGTGGLARAYRDAARAVLEKSKTTEVLLTAKYRLTFPLNLTNVVLRILSGDGIHIIESNYTDEGQVIFEVRLSIEKKVIEELISKTNARINLEKLQF